MSEAEKVFPAVRNIATSGGEHHDRLSSPQFLHGRKSLTKSLTITNPLSPISQSFLAAVKGFHSEWQLFVSTRSSFKPPTGHACVMVTTHGPQMRTSTATLWKRGSESASQSQLIKAQKRRIDVKMHVPWIRGFAPLLYIPLTIPFPETRGLWPSEHDVTLYSGLTAQLMMAEGRRSTSSQVEFPNGQVFGSGAACRIDRMEGASGSQYARGAPNPARWRSFLTSFSPTSRKLANQQGQGQWVKVNGERSMGRGGISSRSSHGPFGHQGPQKKRRHPSLPDTNRNTSERATAEIATNTLKVENPAGQVMENSAITPSSDK